jgi:L-alanine-DL-glutamate epimerase-like enolase superfamily enzyme
MSEELALYQTDRPRWLTTVAPKQAARISDDTYDDAVLAAVWAAMPRDYQVAVWQLLGDSARTRIKSLRAPEAA